MGESPSWRLAGDAAGSDHHGEQAVRTGSVSAAVSAPRPGWWAAQAFGQLNQTTDLVFVEQRGNATHPGCLLAATTAFIQAGQAPSPVPWNACTRVLAQELAPFPAP